MNWKKAVFGCLLIPIGAMALNPIHMSGYSLVPSSIHKNNVNMELGVHFEASDLKRFYIPISGSFKLSPNVELGAGLKTAWGDVGDNVTHLAAGAKFKLAGGETLQADLLKSLQGNSDDGVALSYWRKRSYSRVFSAGYQLKLGSFEAFTNDALLAFEASAYPQINFSSSVGFQLGFIASSQSNHFEDHLAIDMEPALNIGISRASKLNIALTVGLAGERKEQAHLEVNWIKGF